MDVDSMITEGLYLMMVGMGFVVSFLTILVIILYIMEKLIGHEVAEVASASSTRSTQQTDNSPLMAVISAAVHQHRQQSKQ